MFVCLFACFTSQVNSYGHGGTVSSPNHTFSWASLNKQLTSTSCTYFRLSLTTTLLGLLSGREENDRRNYFMINIHESMKRGRDELATPGSAVRLVSVARHVTDCATRPGMVVNGKQGKIHCLCEDGIDKCPSRSPFVITLQASGCQIMILGLDFSIPSYTHFTFYVLIVVHYMIAMERSFNSMWIHIFILRY